MYEITYPEEGFANILGQLIQQKLSQGKQKQQLARELKGTIVIEATDVGVSATLEFDQNGVRMYNGKPSEGSYALVSGKFEIISSIASRSGILRTLLLILSGRLKVKGVRMASKLTALLK